MKDIKIMFLHGLEGTPEGSKPTFLKGEGYRVVAPALPKDDWELSVRRAEDCFLNFRPDIVVGSSRGGAIAAAFPTGHVPKILIAPAWKKFRLKNLHVENTTTVLHCKNDELVEYTDSERLQDLGCRLIECGTCHRMSDPHALEELLKTVKFHSKNEV
ncbi:MAG: hypothetical protein CBC29_07340 [Methylococcaceae bacterium TMED69]|nr:MAG: hypothetical protein CBC29_05520 [Methylococcaceae bacterium TMED69]OUU74934.1 MAG: hypothetical protein CBC29_07340 [Methylococcaceae bacterium TMED69]|tara:strand:+ start:558 stop:1031 length:474 start_codon:yes stop_codon:yes gene_type:complete